MQIFVTQFFPTITADAPLGKWKIVKVVLSRNGIGNPLYCLFLPMSNTSSMMNNGWMLCMYCESIVNFIKGNFFQKVTSDDAFRSQCAILCKIGQ